MAVDVDARLSLALPIAHEDEVVARISLQELRRLAEELRRRVDARPDLDGTGRRGLRKQLGHPRSERGDRWAVLLVPGGELVIIALRVLVILQTVPGLDRRRRLRCDRKSQGRSIGAVDGLDADFAPALLEQ